MDRRIDLKEAIYNLALVLSTMILLMLSRSDTKAMHLYTYEKNRQEEHANGTLLDPMDR